MAISSLSLVAAASAAPIHSVPVGTKSLRDLYPVQFYPVSKIKEVEVAYTQKVTVIGGHYFYGPKVYPQKGGFQTRLKGSYIFDDYEGVLVGTSTVLSATDGLYGELFSGAVGGFYPGNGYRGYFGSTYAQNLWEAPYTSIFPGMAGKNANGIDGVVYNATGQALNVKRIYTWASGDDFGATWDTFNAGTSNPCPPSANYLSGAVIVFTTGIAPGSAGHYLEPAAGLSPVVTMPAGTKGWIKQMYASGIDGGGNPIESLGAQPFFWETKPSNVNMVVTANGGAATGNPSHWNPSGLFWADSSTGAVGSGTGTLEPSGTYGTSNFLPQTWTAVQGDSSTQVKYIMVRGSTDVTDTTTFPLGDPHHFNGATANPDGNITIVNKKQSSATANQAEALCDVLLSPFASTGFTNTLFRTEVIASSVGLNATSQNAATSFAKIYLLNVTNAFANGDNPAETVPATLALMNADFDQIWQGKPLSAPGATVYPTATVDGQDTLVGSIPWPGSEAVIPAMPGSVAGQQMNNYENNDGFGNLTVRVKVGMLVKTPNNAAWKMQVNYVDVRTCQVGDDCWMPNTSLSSSL